MARFVLAIMIAILCVSPSVDAQEYTAWDDPGHRPFTGATQEACDGLGLSPADCAVWQERRESGACEVRQMPDGERFAGMMSTYAGRHRALKNMEVHYGSGWAGESKLAEYCHIRGQLWVVTPRACNNTALLYAPPPPAPPAQALCPSGYVPVDVPSARRPRIFLAWQFTPLLLSGEVPADCPKCTRWARGQALFGDRPPPGDPVWGMASPVSYMLSRGTETICVPEKALVSFCDEDGSNDPTYLIYEPGTGRSEEHDVLMN